MPVMGTLYRSESAEIHNGAFDYFSMIAVSSASLAVGIFAQFDLLATGISHSGGTCFRSWFGCIGLVCL